MPKIFAELLRHFVKRFPPKFSYFNGLRVEVLKNKYKIVSVNCKRLKKINHMHTNDKKKKIHVFP